MDRKYARDYYREVLLSYRLIFAEGMSSHTIYNALKDDWARSFEETADPLLDILCGQKWDDDESMEIWNEIGAGYPIQSYSTQEFFPFFGQRLMLLRNAALSHEPDGIRKLWYDKRDTLRWWTFWVGMQIAP